jgi:hypothetical protein
MMGNRGSANGLDFDAFSRRARPMLSWRRGELRKIKRAFAKRARQTVRRSMGAARPDPILKDREHAKT